MIWNVPGRTFNGMSGPFGQVSGFGRWWEPDMYPDYDLLDEHPTAQEIVDLRSHRNQLPFSCQDFNAFLTGGICSGQNDSRAYKVKVIVHTLTFNNHVYQHYCLLRYPRIGSTAPTSGVYPIILVLHGNESVLEVEGITHWDSLLNRGLQVNFYTDQCAVLFPLYFGYLVELPDTYTLACQNAIGDLPQFNGESYGSDETIWEQLQTDYLSEHYTRDDVQIMAIVQSLTGVLANETSLGIGFSGAIGIIGSSMGAGMLYKVAPILHANEAPGTLKACAADFGGTDQYADFNVRREKRWLRSAIQESYYDNVYREWRLRTRRTYSDISKNQKERLKSPGVQEYLRGADPSHSIPPNLKEDLRYWFLEDSVARYWQYASGPYPLQVNHGTRDPTVPVENSRWLASYMRYKEVEFDANHFRYFETNGAGHKDRELSEESLRAVADMLYNEMGY